MQVPRSIIQESLEKAGDARINGARLCFEGASEMQ
jgi:hypothetical protein